MNQSIHPASGSLCIWILVATDLCRTNKWQLLCKILDKCWNDHCKRMSCVTVDVPHANEPSQLNGHECQALVKIISSSTVKMKSPLEWKFIELEKKSNKKGYHTPDRAYNSIYRIQVTTTVSKYKITVRELLQPLILASSQLVLW